MSEMNLENMTPAQMEFFSQEMPIKILPSVTLKAMDLSCGRIPEMRPKITSEVPLWVAMFLRTKQKCRIRIPDMFDIDALERAVEDERKAPQFLRPLPPNFFELFKLLYSKLDLFLLALPIIDSRHLLYV